LITPIISGASTPTQRQDYAETPLTKIDLLQFDELHSLQHSHHECSEKLCSDQELQLCSRQLRLKLLLFIAFISEPPFSDKPAQANFCVVSTLYASLRFYRKRSKQGCQGFKRSVPW